MREIRLSGSEGGGTLVLPTPIQKTRVLTQTLQPLPVSPLRIYSLIRAKPLEWSRTSVRGSGFSNRTLSLQ
jgi:hypothetical protein